MSQPRPESAADPARLTDALPAPSGPWQRTDSKGGIVEYRVPNDGGVCAAGKIVVRPELFEASAVRVDRKQGCHDAGTTRHESVESAVDTVTSELATAIGE